MVKRIFLMMACGAMLFSCSNHELMDSGHPAPTTLVELDKQEAQIEFARVLSSVVSECQEVRELLKQEALKQFDKNYDVLWAEVRDAEVDGQSLRDLLVAKSSEEFMQQVEVAVPLLNILFPSISMFDVAPEAYDSQDAELPVAIPSSDANLLFYGGVLTDSLAKGEVPGFHLLVVNENSRVEVDPLYSLRAVKGARYRFISDAFDGTKSELRSEEPVSAGRIGWRAIKAFEYFNQDDASNSSMALQRDYIYYGMTPTSKTGILEASAREYLSFIEVDPNVYFKISNQAYSSVFLDEDPRVIQDEVSVRRRKLSCDELIDALWTKAAYNFRFDIMRSNARQPMIKYISVKPEDLWDFHIQTHYRRPTLFRRSKSVYKINPMKFTSKRYYLPTNAVVLDRWDIAQEGLRRYVEISEEDLSREVYSTKRYEFPLVVDAKFRTGLKFGLGPDVDDIGIPTSSNSETKAFRIVRRESSDYLGNSTIYFYDPIIKGEILKEGRMTEYKVNTYSTGSVEFGILAY